MNAFQDMPDDLDFSVGSTISVEQSKANTASRLQSPLTAANAAVYTSPCKKCSGRGRFISYTGRDVGACFVCNGSGTQSFKTSQADRDSARVKRVAREVRQQAERVEDFKSDNAEAFAWMTQASARGFEFATSMLEAVSKYGSLTERQLAAVQNCIRRDAERDAARAAERAAQAARVQAVDASALVGAFFKAATSGLKNPKLTFGTYKVTRASANGRNPGALYVIEKSADLYLGKIIDGQFFPSRDCGDEVKAEVIKLIENPAKAVKAYGLRTGNCAICNRELTAGESIERGIGPICAEKFGF